MASSPLFVPDTSQEAASNNPSYDEADEATPRPAKPKPRAVKAKANAKGRKAEIPAPTEKITETPVWLSMELTNLAPFQKVMLHNQEVLAAQLTMQMAQLEVLIDMVTKMRNVQSRRSSVSSARSEPGEPSEFRDLEGLDEEVSESQDQLQLQQDIQSDRYISILADRYNNFIKMNKKKPYVSRIGQCKADAKAFQDHLIETLPQEDDLGPDHPFPDLIRRASSKTFLDIYVELGKAHPDNASKPAKPAGKKGKRKGKEVQTVSASQNTVVETIGENPDEGLNEGLDEDEDLDEDLDEDADITGGPSQSARKRRKL